MTTIIAHRGARSIAPENTLLAAQKGYDAGAALWETDVTVTRDGQLILFHDDSLERTTNVEAVFPDAKSFRVTEFALDQVLCLDAGSFFINTDPFGQIRAGHLTEKEIQSFKYLKVPTLAQGLELTQTLQWRVNLELKKSLPSSDWAIPQMVVKAVEKAKIDPSCVVISSFYHPWLEEIQNTIPEIRTQALIDNLDQISIHETDPNDPGRFDTYNIWDVLVDEALIQRLKDLNKTINVYTVNDPDRVAFLVRAGVDGIFTDFPQRFA